MIMFEVCRTTCKEVQNLEIDFLACHLRQTVVYLNDASQFRSLTLSFR